jgi:serine/threonine-protein kinase
MASDTRIGTEIAGYRIESMLGRGGMSVVYLAEDIRLKRKAALKLLASELADDESFRQRFISESELAASLDHPNVIPIFEAGEAQGVLFIAMRYVKTIDLKGLIKASGHLDLPRALSIVGQMASALDTAHAEGLVHRDVKPANILVAEGQGTAGADHAYLSDFGLTKRQEAPTGLTRTGQFVGTVDYVAPEQIEGRQIDGRTDQYALACVLFESLAGKPPFVKETETAALIAHLMEEPPSITAVRPELPAALDAVLAKGMARNMEDRYATCGDFARAAADAAREGPGSVSTAATRPAGTFTAGDPAPAPFTAPPMHAPAPGGFQPAPAPFEPAPGAAPPFAPPPAPRKRRTGILIAGLIAAAAVIGILVVVLSGGGGGGTPQASGGNGSGPATGPSVATVSFSDDFSNTGKGSWDTGSIATQKVAYVDGEYQTKVKDGPFAAGVPHTPELANLGDVTIQVDATAAAIPGSGFKGWGIACRTTENTNSYYVIIEPNGVYAFEKSDSSNQPVLKVGRSPRIKRGPGTTNHIALSCTGGEGGGTVTMGLAVNGQFVDTAQDTPQPDQPARGSVGTDQPGVFATGTVALVAVGPTGLDVRFDNFRLESPGEPIAP